jgi:hypothetical protein
MSAGKATSTNRRFDFKRNRKLVLSAISGSGGTANG